MQDLLLTFYGDDFTGSTDLMEALTLNGVPTALFLSPPTPDDLAGRFAELRALGVAGVSRAMTPEQMRRELPPAFEALKPFRTPLFHYKVCSTFDSSPSVGSIGCAIDIGADTFDTPFIPLIVGAPALRRYVAFGNLFATVSGDTYRLDRHPTMSKHPVTPMTESDLRLHLGKQTRRSIGLIDLRALAESDEQLDQRLKSTVSEGAEVVVFDTLDTAHLQKIGRLLWESRGSLFVAGSSGVEYALATYWESIGLIEKPAVGESPGAVEQIIVMSGSAAPPTAEQISHAEQMGFHLLRLDGARLIDPASAEAEREAVIQAGLNLLATGHSLLLFLTRGSDDPAIGATRARAAELGIGAAETGARLGRAQGKILRALLERSAVKRVCVAGGDTSGHTAHQLDIMALEVLVPVAPGAPLCRASSHNSRFDGLQIAFKGGQNGQVDYFSRILGGVVDTAR